MKRYAFIAVMLLASLQFSSAAVHNVREYGAKGDGVSIDSPAIDKAIKAASDEGGGTVFVPAGVYACYSIHLASHIRLEIEKGAVIKAAKEEGALGFDAPEENPHDAYQDFGHSYWKNSLIWGIGLEDVTICGGGMIDGSNLSNGYNIGKKSKTGIASDFELPTGIGNKAIALKNCRDVNLDDIRIFRGGHFCLLATGVDGLIITRLRIDTNRDGLDIDCCRNVLISDCIVNSPRDDGIVLKSSYALGSFRPTENVTITNCCISGYVTGSVFSGEYIRDTKDKRSAGRVKLGTESSGGFKRIAVSNCVLEHCGGLHVETTDGGPVEDISFDNIIIRDCSDSPVFVMIGQRLRSPGDVKPGYVRRVHFSNINVYDARPEYGMIISGIPGQCIEDVTLSNINYNGRGGLTKAAAGAEVPEMEKQYPDPKSFGVMPSKGLYLRHVRGVKMSGLNFSYLGKDDRSTIVKVDCK